ncbi:MAG: beta-galactosidase [Clostridiales bacterium]|nr:beta-galactosidase [Clostridiales bacterium]
MCEFIWKKRLLHGGDYNPDQWLNRPDILAEDIRLMKAAEVNCVSLGIFAWAALEPEEGKFNFGWLRDIIDDLYDNGIYTILATPSGARPLWLAHKYGEVLRVSKDLTRDRPGERHNHCYTSPVYREKVYEINKRLAAEFSQNSAVILWHISNEFGGECYCPLCQSAFRDWLKQEYKTLHNLNQQWWTTFWSHTYTDWNQVEAPVPTGETGTHGLNLAWKRFVTHQTVDFCAWEKRALEDGGSTLPVTTNLMGFYDGLNYFKFKDVLDVVSWDSYPRWHRDDDVDLAVHTAAAHDKMRTIKKRNFLLMESTPSMTNWMPVSKNKRPGMHMLSSIQSLAHGADSVMYFQWRKSRGSCEKFHGAVIGHDGTGNTRVFKDVAELGQRLIGLTGLAEKEIESRVAIIHDIENQWAIENCAGPRNAGLHYTETVISHYKPFWEMGISVDLPDMECDFSQYKLVIAPMLYMYRGDILNKLRRFTESGGILVGTYMSGIADENDLCFESASPYGMVDVFGVESYEIDALYDDDFYETKLFGIDGKLTELAQIIKPLTAKVLAEYKSDFNNSEPVLTYNEFGAGKAYYIAARLDENLLRALYSKMVEQIGLARAVEASLPAGVTAARRGDIIILQNFNFDTVRITLPKLTDTETDEELQGMCILKPYEVRFLRN